MITEMNFEHCSQLGQELGIFYDFCHCVSSPVLFCLSSCYTLLFSCLACMLSGASALKNSAFTVCNTDNPSLAGF